ncbi:MAG: nitroreductase family protein [Chloroflexota bacterium]
MTPGCCPGYSRTSAAPSSSPSKKGGPGPNQHPRAYTVVLINRSWEADANRRRVTHYDIGIAAQSIILTAYEQGIGTCPILMINEDGLKKSLKIPDGYDVGMVIAMGYPDESPITEVADPSPDFWIDDKAVRHVPKRKLEDVIHRNGF